VKGLNEIGSIYSSKFIIFLYIKLEVFFFNINLVKSVNFKGAAVTGFFLYYFKYGIMFIISKIIPSGEQTGFSNGNKDNAQQSKGNFEIGIYFGSINN